MTREERSSVWRLARLTGVLLLAVWGGPVRGDAAGKTESASAGHWVATWTAAMMRSGENPAAMKASVGNETIRMTVHTAIGGRALRLHLSNVFGRQPLRIRATRVGVLSAAAGAMAGSASGAAAEHTVRFNGKDSVTIPAGAPMISDPLALDFPPGADLVVTLAVPEGSLAPTWHELALQTTYITGGGDQVAESNVTACGANSSPLGSRGCGGLAPSSPVGSWYFLSEVDALAPAASFAIVAMGDSITDGTQSTPNANHRWPNYLAQRLAGAHGVEEVSVVNEGISGNRVLHDETGPNALARLDRDAWTVADARTLIVLEGINDLGFPAIPGGQYAAQVVTAEQIIDGYKQIIERAHAQGMHVIGGTLTPFEGAGYATPEGESKREAVNQWIRKGGGFDGVIDFEEAVRDPKDPKHFAAAYDSGDHLHPSDAGYKKMAEAIDLEMLRRVSQSPISH